MKTISFLLSILLGNSCLSNGFQVVSTNTGRATKTASAIRRQQLTTTWYLSASSSDNSNNEYHHNDSSRRDFLEKTRATLLTSVSALALLGASPEKVSAAVGDLPEYAETNAVLQGITIRVADKSQQDSMIKFLSDAFDFEVLRKRVKGSTEETWMGYGPEELSIPKDFTLPVSSFAKYGGHASIHIVYDSKATTPLYRKGDAAPGNNIAYLQVGVPAYRISQMVVNGGNVLDAYGIVNVVSPSGLPMRGIVGIWPDPMMFVAINCADVQASRAHYERLGFVEQEYPYARPNKGQGQFEPPQPPKSVYLAPSPNCMGVLLLPVGKKRGSSITPNPVFESLNVVYNPTAGGSSDAAEADEFPPIVDPSGVGTSFQAVNKFKAEELATR